MSVSLYQFLPQVSPHVQGCPDIVAVEALRTATIRLCEIGMVWKHEFDPIDTVANSPDYELETDTGAYVFSIHSVTYLGRMLTPTTPMALDNTIPGWRDQIGTPQMFYRSADDAINLVLTPSASAPGGLIVTAILEPTRSNTLVDDALYQRYLPDIARGALAELLIMPNKPWSNPQLAAMYEMDFMQRCSAARAQFFSDYANVRLKARSPYKFG